jgi:hypothetical protein
MAPNKTLLYYDVANDVQHNAYDLVRPNNELSSCEVMDQA